MAQDPLVDLERMLERLYGPHNFNEEKAAIERQLEEFRRSTFNWRTSIMHLSLINNQYVWYFMASTVERAINADWQTLSAGEQGEIHHLLLQLYSDLPGTAPALQRNKIAAMLTTIAQLKPAQFREFIRYVQGLLGQKLTLGLGLVWAINDRVAMKRGSPETDRLQCTFVGNAKEHARTLLTALNNYCALFVMIQQGNVPETLPGGVTLASVPQNVTAVLDVLQQCFSWIRLVGVDASVISNVAFLARSGDAHRDGAVSAMTALTELLYRNESLIPDAGRQLGIAVHEILRYAGEHELDDLYHDKVCELMRQYVKRGWPYSNPTADIRIEQTLQLLLRYTTGATNAHMLMDRFHVWTYVCGLQGADDGDGNVNETVWPGLVVPYAQDLISRLLRSLFFRTYPDLGQLDDSELDEHSLTERGRFLTTCIDLIMQLLSMFPDNNYTETLGWLVLDPQSPYRQGVNEYISKLGAPLQLGQLQERAHALPDYLTASKLLMRLCTTRYGVTENLCAAVHQVTNEQIQLLVGLCRGTMRPAQFCAALKEAHQLNLAPLYAQLLKDIKQYMQMGPANNNRAGSASRTLTVAVPDETKAMVRMCLPLFLVNDSAQLARCSDWQTVAEAAVDLLLFYVHNNVGGTAGTTASHQVFHALIQAGIVNQKLYHLGPSTAGQVQSLVCQCLLNASSCPANEEIPTLSQYLAFLVDTVVNFPDESLWGRLPASERSARIEQQTGELVQFATLFRCVAGAGYSGAKRAAIAAHLSPIVGRLLAMGRSALQLVTWAATDAVSCRFIDALLECCYSVVSALPSQLDVRVMQDVLDLLHQVFRSEETQGVHRLRSATTMLKTLRQMVQQPQNNALMPAIVRVALQELLPIVGSDELYRNAMSSSEAHGREEVARYEQAALELYQLLQDLLHYRWKYFVDTNPQRVLEPGTRTIVQPEAFVAIMNAFENVLRNQCGFPVIVKQVLASLNMLGARRMIFALPIFAQYMMESYLLSVLMLASGCQGALHQEQIVQLLHTMTRAEPVRLNVAICDQGIPCDVHTLQMLQRAEDFPSFKIVVSGILERARN